MAGIAGVAETGQSGLVERMLDKIAHRGKAGRRVAEFKQATLGAVWPPSQTTALRPKEEMVKDSAGDGHLAAVQIVNGKPLLVRDLFGVAPLYYGRTSAGVLCFASEVKGLLAATKVISSLPPACSYDGESLACHYRLAKKPPLKEDPGTVALKLRRKLEAPVQVSMERGQVGAWLSGGLDSSAIVAMARPWVAQLHTFAAGLAGAPDLEYAREVAHFLKCTHHEVVIAMGDMLRVLPEVIYHLESFDALLVRSSVVNYLAARRAADDVAEVLSGEGGDELFAGYAYLKVIAPQQLADELVDITARLHNTALQRVDRCACAHGLVAHVPFLTPRVVEYTLRIPAEYKIRDGVEKWILREAIGSSLPAKVLNRPKVKFWEGAGVGALLSDHADQQVSDGDFSRERVLPNGWRLASKEELMYYRIFREPFGQIENLSWMGRTKDAPGS